MSDISGLKPYLVRVINQFDSEFSDELNSSANDLIQIESKLDKYWFYGHSNGRFGKIPVNNCREVTISADRVADNQCLFAAINDFINDCIDGDLRFRRGDLIIGFGPIDENWWNGCLYDNPHSIGIFPLTHVWKLDPNLLPKRVIPSEETNDIKYCKVMVEMKSQLDNEIDLFKDEILKISDNYDKMYFKGESMDGQRKGIFPKNFVKILDDFQPNNAQSSEQTVMNSEELVANNTNNTFIYNNEENPYNMCSDNPPSYENVINQCSANGASTQPSSLGYSNTYIGDVESYGRALFRFKAQFPNELSLKENEIVHLIRHIDNEWIEGEVDGRVGIFPKSFVEIIVDCDLNNTLLTEDMHTISISEDFPIDTFGRVLYDFDGEVEGDLKVRKGDTLTLIRKIDNNWLEVMDDLGSVGLVPNVYCELIDDISSNHSRTASTIEDNTIESIEPNDENNFYPNFSNVDENLEPVADHSDIDAVIIQEFDPIISDIDNNNTLRVRDNTVTEPTHSPKIPRRPAPAVPKDPESTKPIQLSPQRAPPPVPKHKTSKRLKERVDSVDSLNFNRQESIRSSVTSISSSGSGKSEAASGLTTTQVTVEDQRRVDERKKKVREQRSCVIMELLQTERDYKQNLMVCANIFLRNPEEARNNGIDLDKLFGNLEEIIEVSAHLIQLLEESTQMKKYENQKVGKCFLDISDQMRSAYSIYCRNHDQIQPIFDRYDAQPKSKQYLQKGLDIMREQTNCFDIPSVLIKPVQRILKYPLLLNELHKCTEDGHEDKPDLILAIDQITDMATHINEYKRRQDLVHKYRSEGSATLSARLSKLTLHTVKKKSSRLGHRITSTLGLSSNTKDDELNKEVQKLRTVEKTIKIFVKDKQAFMKSAEDFTKQGLSVVEAIAEYYDKKNKQQEVEQLRTTHRVIVTQYWQEFNNAVDRDVTPVLDKLLAKFSGPNKLITKRYDKLTDYDSLSKKLECNKDTTRQRGLQELQQMAKNVYEALNSQLLEELPKLCDISMEILHDCIQAFLMARKQLIGRIAKHHLFLLELPLVLGFSAASVADITETFQIKHNLISEQLLEEILILPNSVFPNASTSGPKEFQTDFNRKHSTRGSRKSLINVSVANSVGVNQNRNQNVQQSPSQRAYLQSRYQSHQLYEAVKPYDVIDIMDIYLNKGDLVGVVKQQDPMGGKHRWFVDTGNAQGFVFANILIPYHDDSWVTPPKPSKSKTTESTTLHTINEKSALNFSANHSPNPSPNPNPMTSSAQHQYKLYPSPDPPVQLRHDVETHRYEEVEDSPPRYSRLETSDNTYNNLLSFDDSADEKHLQSLQSYNFGEFDPYAPLAQIETKSSSITTVTEHRYEEVSEECSAPSLPTPTPQRQLSERPVLEVYTASYPFKAMDKNQLSLEFGQSVTVQYKCDLSGNKDWWFVTDRDGRSGYVPANYLIKPQSK